jgi:hypothetical protein
MTSLLYFKIARNDKHKIQNAKLPKTTISNRVIFHAPTDFLQISACHRLMSLSSSFSSFKSKVNSQYITLPCLYNTKPTHFYSNIRIVSTIMPTLRLVYLTEHLTSASMISWLSKQKYGHSDVPQRGENASIGKWCKDTRASYKKIQNNQNRSQKWNYLMNRFNTWTMRVSSGIYGLCQRMVQLIVQFDCDVPHTGENASLQL